MKAYVINGKKKTIEVVEYDGTFEGLAKLSPYSGMALDGGLLSEASEDFMITLSVEIAKLFGSLLTEKDGSFGWKCPHSDEWHPISGIAIVVGSHKVRDSGSVSIELQDPSITLDELKSRINFSDNFTIHGLYDQVGDLLKVMEGKDKEEETDTCEHVDAKSAVENLLEVQRIATKY